MWVRLDDRFSDHPKVVGLSDKAFRVHVSALCYANRHRTNGVLSLGMQRALRATPKVASELVRAGIWELAPQGGVRIHDYLEYQPTPEEIAAHDQRREEIRRARAEAGRMGGIRSGQARRAAKQTKQTRTPVPVPVASYRSKGLLRAVGGTAAQLVDGLRP